MSWITTYSGARFDFAAPCLEDIHIADIAHALSRICRFTGHTRRFYSVAQHSVLVSRIVPPEHALAGLLHDAHKAYVGNVATPLKDHLPGYREVEARAWRAVATRLGVDPALPASIKQADIILLATERRDLLPRDGRVWPVLDNVVPLFDRIAPLGPEEAEALFLARYREITSQARGAASGDEPSAGRVPVPRFSWRRLRRVFRALFVERGLP
ncbi:hypothetical protein [Acidiferrobacter sp.]|uniref:hypothetical protein n=1 Tax=Acidiferrobacter sp. TaxID=1872107 RepID=UPI002636714D|nr:hypothetical protein [Acidiferrobacter sp.]